MQKAIIKLILGICSLLLVSSLHTANATTEVRVYDSKPIKLTLKVGREHLIYFEDNIRYGMPEGVLSKVKVSAAAGVIYVTPMQQFASERFQIELSSSGQIIYLDIQAITTDDDSLSDEIRIVMASEQIEKSTTNAKVANSNSKKVTIRQLVQFAAQDFYAPQRLKPTDLPITEKIIERKLFLDNLFMGSSSGLFELTAVKEYKTSRYVLTAIALKNTTLENQKVIYQDLYPDFITVSSQHLYVGPRHTNEDTTMLYYVTKTSLLDEGAYSL